jgi:Zn finger protein HypA/HybF involved in hydrogenase expression
MVISGFEVYLVYCEKCGWEEQITVTSFTLLVSELPKKCPKCSSKVKKIKIPVIF